MSDLKQAPAAPPAPLVAVKGMNDILPPDSARWEWFEETVRALMRRYGYLNIRVPIVEPTPLFVRGLGEVTDIVEKEMYSFIDSMNGDALTLRPEGTAGVVRAAVEHSMLYDGGCFTTAASACSTSARCSATKGRNVADTGNSTKWVSRHWASAARMWTPR